MKARELEEEIASAEDTLNRLKEELAILKSVEAGILHAYIGNYIIQDMYETGVRFLYVTDARVREGLELKGYGALWDEQSNELGIIPSDEGMWFSRADYGTIVITTKEDFIQAIKDLVCKRINEEFL